VQRRRETTECRTAMSLFGSRFGKVFDMIRPLPDFVLFVSFPMADFMFTGLGKHSRSVPI
jgi:hypothetical protein